MCNANHIISGDFDNVSGRIQKKTSHFYWGYNLEWQFTQQFQIIRSLRKEDKVSFVDNVKH